MFQTNQTHSVPVGYSNILLSLPNTQTFCPNPFCRNFGIFILTSAKNSKSSKFLPGNHKVGFGNKKTQSAIHWDNQLG